MTERIARTQTLLNRREKIDVQLALREGIEHSIFTQVHSKCSTSQSRIGLNPAGYNATHEAQAYNPIWVLQCHVHKVSSASYWDWKEITYA